MRMSDFNDVVDFERRKAGVDSYGSQVNTWSNLFTAGCRITQSGFAETTRTTREVASSVIQIDVRFMKAATELTTNDRVTFNGRQYDIRNVDLNYTMNRRIIRVTAEVQEGA